MDFLSKQKIPLRHWQTHRWLAGEQLTIGVHAVGLRVNFHLGQVGVVDHVLLLDAANVAHRAHIFSQWWGPCRSQSWW